MRKRGFEKINKYIKVDFPMPERKTKSSAGYDFCLPEEICLSPNKLAMVPTGIKAYMQEDEYLGIHIRSSIAIKKEVSLVNNEGIIDADYYNNPDNEGHIFFQIINLGPCAVKLQKGDRIGQGIIKRYYLADGDSLSVGASRIGGFGSTGSH